MYDGFLGIRGLNAGCVPEFSHAREGRNKEEPSSLDFGCLQDEQEGEGRRGDSVSRALCRLFPSPPTPTHFCRQCRGKKRSRERDPEGIPSEYGCQALSAFIFDYLAHSSTPLFLSFNLRLDCRLHIVPSSLLPNFDSLPSSLALPL